jgi:hypothetical protein
LQAATENVYDVPFDRPAMSWVDEVPGEPLTANVPDPPPLDVHFTLVTGAPLSGGIVNVSVIAPS